MTRAELWHRFGEPDDQSGSVNEPRTKTEHGFEWNEKWTWLTRDGSRPARVALWNRYDLVAVCRVDASRAWHPEELA